MTWPDGFCPNGWSILPVSTSLMVELVHFHTPTICDAKSCDAAGWANQREKAVAAAADVNKCFMVSSKLVGSAGRFNCRAPTNCIFQIRGRPIVGHRIYS